ncbi:MAG: DUF2240 family protein [Asgard group archaeon]|nr:DUF2240 family protein [Asgard group archaeon]
MTLNMPYEEIVEKIVNESNLSKEEVIKKINDKVDELGGLITHDGAAHIIARDLEINLYNSQQIEKPKPTKINELISGMNNVTVTAMIKHAYEPNLFTRNNDGSQGAVQNIHLVDKTGYCRLVLWDDQIRQFNDMGVSRGDIIRILGVFVKESKFDGIKELSLSSRTQIDLNPKDANKKEFPESLLAHLKIQELEENQVDVELIGKITATRSPSSFTKKTGGEGIVASLEVADETGKVKITLWDQNAEIANNYKINDVIEIIGGYTRKGIYGTIEVHLGKNGSIKKHSKTKLEIPEEIMKSESLISGSPKKIDEPCKEVRLMDLIDGMTNISIIARITGISEIRQFQRKTDGTTSEVGSLLVVDNSGPGKVTLWNSSVEYIKKVEIGDVIRIEGAYVKLGLRDEPEVHVGRNSKIEINPEHLKDVLPELEINYSKLSELQANLRDVNVKAIITRVQEIRTFTKSDGVEGHVLNFGIRDNTGSVRLVAWNKKAIELEDLTEMTPIEILHGYTKEGMQGVEIHLGKLSSVRKLEKNEIGQLAEIKPQTNLTENGKIERVDMIDLEENQFSEVRGSIVKIYEGNMFYLSCPQCRKKVIETDDNQLKCNEHGIVETEKTIFISLALDDGTGCVRITFFGELAEQLLGMSSTNLIDQIENTGIQSVVVKLEQYLKGKEIIVRGRTRRSKFDDGMDITATAFFEIDPKVEIDLVKNTLKV